MSVPSSARFLIIGAGVHGLSTAYHLALQLKARGAGSGGGFGRYSGPRWPQAASSEPARIAATGTRDRRAARAITRTRARSAPPEPPPTMRPA